MHAPDEPAEAEVDERRVERIMRNLLVNAIEHGDGRPVDIHVAIGDDAVAVVVEDHGVGLRPGEAANVFTRFWRADPARARTTGGTGLGLSISLEDARLHNGWLQAWGERGRRLAVPPHPAAAGRRHPARVAAAAQPHGGPVTGRRARARPRAAASRSLLAGCGGLSRSGDVQPGLDVASGNPQGIRVLFPGPAAGVDQVSIVRGFVRAGSASDAAYDNARAFLTAQTSEKWNPDRTLVLLADDVAPKATLLDPATVRITAKAAGTVDPEGRYTAARAGSTVTATFGLSTVGGEWRISELPDDVRPLDRQLRGVPARAALRPALRLDQPARPRARHPVVPRRQARDPAGPAQLVPVPAHLADASVTAVPVGSRLLGDAVSIDSGVATVNLLTNTKLSAGETTRQNLWAQFVSTLTQDTGVSRIVLSVNGVPVNIAGLDGSAGTLAEVGFTTPPTPALARPVVRRGDDVVVFDPSTLGDAEPRQPAVSGSYPPVLHTFRRLALSADGAELAGVDPDGNGISRWRGTNRYEVPLDATNVGNPAYDRRGFLWMGGVGTKGAKAPRLWVVDLTANPADPRAAATAVEAAWLARAPRRRGAGGPGR